MDRALIQHNYKPNQEAIQAGKGAGAPLGNTMRIASPFLAENGHFPRGKWAKQAKNWCANSGEISGTDPGGAGLDFRVVRWALQGAARELLSGASIRYCLRRLIPDAEQVEVWRHDETGRAHYKNLCVCGSVWTCAPCSSKISERRRVELKQALDQAEQYSFSMVTFTLSHHKKDKLAPLVDDLLASYRRMTSGKAYQEFAERSGIVGNIKALEVTYSDRNGFHPHLHVLIVSQRGAKVDRRWLKSRWQSVIESNGRTADYWIGCNFRVADMSAAEYVEKYGHERIKDYWGASGELTKGASKLARDAHGFSMFQCLYNSITAPDEKQRSRWGRIFQEYVEAFKGKHQLQYSKGLRELLGLGVELSDKELAEGGEYPSSLLARLSLRQWRVVLGNDARGDILSAAEKGIEALNEFLNAIGAGRLPDDDDDGRRVKLTRLRPHGGEDDAGQFAN